MPRIRNVCVALPQCTAQELADLVSDRRVPIEAVMQSIRGERRRARVPIAGRQVLRLTARMDTDLVLADARLWERTTGERLQAGEAVVYLDGDPSNGRMANLYRLRRHELIRALRILRDPLESKIFKLELEIMALDTSEAVKKELLKVLEQLVDKEQQPDLVRQRAICETVQTLVGVLKVEVAYIRAIEGDGVVTFLEGAHKEAMQRREATRKKLFPAGPAADHPWRGLGSRGDERP